MTLVESLTSWPRPRAHRLPLDPNSAIPAKGAGREAPPSPLAPGRWGKRAGRRGPGRTWMTRMLRPVSCASCSRMWRVGLGVAAKAALSVSSCLALMVVRGPRRLVPEFCSSFSLLAVSLSEDVELSVSLGSSWSGSWRSGDKLRSVQDDTAGGRSGKGQRRQKRPKASPVGLRVPAGPGHLQPHEVPPKPYYSPSPTGPAPAHSFQAGPGLGGSLIQPSGHFSAIAWGRGGTPSGVPGVLGEGTREGGGAGALGASDLLLPSLLPPRST